MFFFVFVRDNQGFLIICQAKTANPFSNIALIQDIDVRLGVLICNLMDVHKAATLAQKHKMLLKNSVLSFGRPSMTSSVR